MLRRRLPSVSLPLPAEVWESRVQPLEKRGIHLLFKKLSQIHLSVLISFHPFLKITRDDKLTLNIPLPVPVDHERFHVRMSGEVEDFLKADDAPGPLFHNFDRAGKGGRLTPRAINYLVTGPRPEGRRQSHPSWPPAHGHNRGCEGSPDEWDAAEVKVRSSVPGLGIILVSISPPFRLYFFLSLINKGNTPAPAQSSPATPLVCPFLTSQRPVSGLCAPGWTLGMPRLRFCQIGPCRQGPCLRSGCLPGLHGANDGAVLVAPEQPRQPERVQARHCQPTRRPWRSSGRWCRGPGCYGARRTR